jgi:hypothetical protein
MFGRNYQNNYGATEFNEAWRVSYTGVLNNIKLMNTIATQGLEKHIGMGQSNGSLYNCNFSRYVW